MKWIKKIFANKESRQDTLNLDQLPGWLESKSRKISEETGRKVSSIFPEIKKTLARIKNSTEELDKSKPEGRFHLKMIKVATSNRDNMSKQVKMLLENIVIPEEKDVKTIITFHKNGMHTLGICLENMMKSYQYTKLVYFEESKDVIADVNSLGRLLNHLVEDIDLKKPLLDALDMSQGLVIYIKKIAVDIDSIERSMKETDARIVFLKKEIEEDQNDLNILIQSQIWKQYVSAKEQLILLESNAQKKSSEINDIISPLSKAINRLKQLSESGRYTLKPEDRDALNICLSCPIDVPPEFFITFQKIVESGELNLQKTDKLLPQIQLAASTLGEKRKEYNLILDEIRTKEDEISKMKVIGEEKELKDSITALEDKLILAEKDIDASRKKIELLKKDLESKRLELQQNISMIDNNVRLS
ncbi:MAG: hypothetical protein OIN87_07150 [Candidatus Methanoperedens sp.]|nr:hypothetical protein [Candidatus Methanoperedens sp.]